MISPGSIEELKLAVNIKDVVKPYTHIDSAGKGLCPFHDEKSASFQIYSKENRYHCFGCHESGDVIDFMMKQNNLSFTEAAKQLAAENNFTLIVENENAGNANLISKKKLMYALNQRVANVFADALIGSPAIEYLKQRGFTEEDARRFNVGFAPPTGDFLAQKLTTEEIAIALELGLISSGENGLYDTYRNRIMFPVTNRIGQIAGFTGRNISDDNQPKYLNSKESEVFHKGQLFFGFAQAKQAIKERNEVILVEGPFDVMAMLNAGLENVVATCGSAFTPNHTKFLEMMKCKVKLALDNDKAGKKATFSAIKTLYQHNILPDCISLIEGVKDWSELWEQYPIRFNAIADQDIKPAYLWAFHQLFLEAKDIESKSIAYTELAKIVLLIKDEGKQKLIIQEIGNIQNIDADILNSAIIQSMNEIKKKAQVDTVTEINTSDVPEYNLDYPGESFFRSGSGKSNPVKFIHLGIIELITHLGFRRATVEKEFILVSIKNNIIKEETTTSVQHTVVEFIKRMPEKFTFNGEIFRRIDILELCFRQNNSFFVETKLSLLPEVEISFLADEAKRAYFPFKNGVVAVSPEGINLIPYDKMSQPIWQNHIVDRDFPVDLVFTQTGDFEEFINLVCNNDRARFLSLRTIIGYLMHNYYPGGEKAMILTDSTLSESANGRTGKGLIVKGIKYIRRGVDLPGKNFDAASTFKYQKVEKDTQFVHLEDVEKKFNFESLYNDITDQLLVEKKNKTPFSIRVKIVISTNRTIKIIGASSEARCVEFEMSDYFGLNRSPDQHFGRFLFTDWRDINESQWQLFDYFMMESMQLYLQKGLIEPEQVNLAERKIIDSCGSEFYEWSKNQDFQLGEDYDKKKLQTDFLTEYDLDSDRSWTPQRFKRALNTLAEIRKWRVEFRNCNSKQTFKFHGK